MPKVVFCEDDPMIQKLIRAALRSEPHEVYVAPDGASGLELIQRELPDVVFTDVSMPGLDGYQLVDRLKADPRTAHIPVIFMTASVQGHQPETIQAHGASGVLPKPFTMADLRERVAAFSSGTGRR